MAEERWRCSCRGGCWCGGGRQGKGGFLSSLHAEEGGCGARLQRRCTDPRGDGGSSISLALSRLNYQPWPQATFIELIFSQLLDDLRGVNVVSPRWPEGIHSWSAPSSSCPARLALSTSCFALTLPYSRVASSLALFLSHLSLSSCILLFSLSFPTFLLITTLVEQLAVI